MTNELWIIQRDPIMFNTKGGFRAKAFFNINNSGICEYLSFIHSAPLSFPIVKITQKTLTFT